MNLLFLFCALFGSVFVSAINYYDTFNSTLLTSGQVAQRVRQGNDFWCVKSFNVCDESEWRRIDGSCNSLLSPTSGAGHEPFARLLPPLYHNTTAGSEPRRGNQASARSIRNRVFKEAIVSGDYTQLMLLFFVFVATDIAAMSIHDTLNYVNVHPNCCNSLGANDPMCIRIQVPTTDPIYVNNATKCLNMTKPISFQSQKCVDNNNNVQDRINFGTPLFDLSNMYGNDVSTSNRQRLFKGGLLNSTTTTSGKEWPQYIAPPVNRYDGIQGLTGVNFFFGLWFWREHNRLARQLSSLNPCWDDDRLFFTARDINIAQYAQMVYYHLFPLLMGKENLINDGIISSSDSFRDPYDPSLRPIEYIESLMSLRWIHTIQEGLIKLYTSDGKYQGSFPETNLTLSTSALNSDQLPLYTQGSFRTESAAYDSFIDPVVGEFGLGRLQKVSDLTSADIVKNRLFNLSPYSEYVRLCDGKQHNSFESLSQYFSTQNLNLLKELYSSPVDVDLIAGLWLEKMKENSFVPNTFYCLVGKQLHLTVSADRHWYERPNRPHAFTASQLAQIRKANINRLLCDHGDTVSESGIQKEAFKRISMSNPLSPCSSFPSLDLSPWKDNCPNTNSSLVSENLVENSQRTQTNRDNRSLLQKGMDSVKRGWSKAKDFFQKMF